MSFRGVLSFCILFLLLATGTIAGMGEGVRLDFTYAISEESVVEKSKEMAKVGSAFVDNDGDGIYDEIHYDGQVINVTVDVVDAQGFSFADGARMAFYPTRLRWLPKPDTYEAIGFLHYWGDFGSQLVALLVHQNKNYQTSDGITVYAINRAGVRVGAMFFLFIEKAFLRYTAPYQEWMQTGHDFAIGTSPTVSNYILMGKDLGLVDTVLVINLSLSATTAPQGQDFKIRKPEPAVVQESSGRPDDWGAYTGETFGGVFNSVKYGGEAISANIMVDKAQGLTFDDDRHIVFYPSKLERLPTSPAQGTNWEILGFIHYFDDDEKVNALLAVLLGQVTGDETTFGTKVRVVDNTGMRAGWPKWEFFPRRSVKIMGTYGNWDTSTSDYALGFVGGVSDNITIVKELGLVDKIMVINFQLY